MGSRRRGNLRDWGGTRVCPDKPDGRLGRLPNCVICADSDATPVPNLSLELDLGSQPLATCCSLRDFSLQCPQVRVRLQTSGGSSA